MAKVARAPMTSLSAMLDPASDNNLAESDNDLMLTPDSAVENVAPPRKKSGQISSKVASNSSKVTKARPPTKRTSGGGTKKATAKKTSTSRKALADRTNARDESEVEEVEEFDESMEIDEAERPAPVAKNNKKPGTHERNQGQTQTKRVRKKQEQYDENDEEENENFAQKPMPKKQSRSAPKAPTAKGRAPSNKQAPPKEQHHIPPSTRHDPMDVDPTTMIGDEESTIDSLPLAPIAKPQPTVRVRSEWRQRRPERTRSASASDREGRTTDPALRRKLGDATKKLENLEIKYRNLQEIGSRTAETNFEKLKKASDERAKHSNELIASLNKDLADLQRRFDTQSVEASACEAKAGNLSEQAKKLENENKSLRQSLQQTESENRSLAGKIAANRAVSLESAAEKEKEKEKEREKKAPASVAKTTNPPSRTTVLANAEAAKEAQIRQMKEDLYSDLTGLIIRGVKREEGEDVYDCIQTGRNGTLHFHLTVANSSTSSEPKTPSNSYEEVEFGYMPLLDESRDKDLKDVLEDYLQEEIFFPRRQAAKFYAKVMDCVTKRIIVDEEEE